MVTDMLVFFSILMLHRYCYSCSLIIRSASVSHVGLFHRKFQFIADLALDTEHYNVLALLIYGLTS